MALHEEFSKINFSFHFISADVLMLLMSSHLRQAPAGSLLSPAVPQQANWSSQKPNLGISSFRVGLFGPSYTVTWCLWGWSSKGFDSTT
jgi:hypothetical protein